MSLAGKKILIGVTGSIAAYKSAFLVRLLVKEEAEVSVILTDAAKEFVGPLTFSTLSKKKVFSDFSDKKTGEWANHVELGMNHDLFLIAPATANTISKAAHGICDNLLMATYLSAKCPVYFAPAMDLDMFKHPSTSENLKKLESFGNTLIEPGTGELASGLEGKGRMAESEDILEVIKSHFKKKSRFLNKRVLITAGPTHEAIDPVRFIGNHSSGKMAYSLAESFLYEGAKVDLVSGPVSLKLEHKNLTLHNVKSAEEMLMQTQSLYGKVDYAVFAAAVSDYKPENQFNQKIKREGKDKMEISLVQNPDIALEMGKLKGNQINIGFALETENLKANAEKKLKKKNFDLIVMNSTNDKDRGFGHDTNKISILDRYNNFVDFELKSKKELARDILDSIINYADHS